MHTLIDTERIYEHGNQDTEAIQKGYSRDTETIQKGYRKHAFWDHKGSGGITRGQEGSEGIKKINRPIDILTL